MTNFMSLYCNYLSVITFIAAAVETASYGYGYEWARKSSSILFRAIIPNKLLSLYPSQLPYYTVMIRVMTEDK